jgi:nitric oxide reductase NorD protein
MTGMSSTGYQRSSIAIWVRVLRQAERPATLRALDYLASAAAGVPLMVEPSAGRPTHCDGRTVYVDASDRNTAINAALLHGVLVAAGSLEARLVGKLRGRPAAARRYLALEARRSALALDTMLPSGWAARTIPAKGATSGSAAESLRMALDQRVAVELLAEALGTVLPGRVRKMAAAGKAAARAEVSLPVSELPRLDDNEEQSTAASRFLKLFSNPLSSGNAVSEIFRSIFGLGHGAGGQDDEPQDDAETSSTTLAGDADLSRAPPGIGAALASRPQDLAVRASEPVLQRYPEWDEAQGRYRADWTEVSEALPWPPEEPYHVESIDLSVKHLERQLFKIGVEHEMHNRQLRGDDLDLDRIVAHAIDLKARQSPRGDVYRASHRTRRDLCALLLLDISRSTGDRLDSGGTVFGQQAAVTRLVAKALDRFGDRIAIYGFHSWGRKLIRFLRVKAFDEKFSAACARRLGFLEPSGLSRLGAAIRHATHLVAHEHYNAHRLIVLLTDGFAYDEGYEGRYAEADTARALLEAQRQGVACVCLSIGTEKDDDALKRVYGAAAYLRCADANDLVVRLKTVAASALHRASQAQRTARTARVRPAGLNRY